VAERWVAQQFSLDDLAAEAAAEAAADTAVAAAGKPEEAAAAKPGDADAADPQGGSAAEPQDAAPEEPPRAVAIRDPNRTITVAEFYERLGGAVHGEFPGAVWVSAEIRKVRDTRAGHRYIELADRDNDEWSGPARDRILEVVCWARDWPPIRKQLKKAGIELGPGLVVRVQGRVAVWDGGGKVRLSMLRIDVEALVGGIAAARARVLAALAEDGIVDANRKLRVPLVPLRIGVVTSAGSEAYRDFAGKLRASGFRFEVRVEDALVQGPTAPRAIAAALRRFVRFAPDLVVLVRGGGARTDLVAYDSEPVARAIVSAPFPVWTGIGHTGDRSVADEVANRSLSTPTACAEAVVERVGGYWDQINVRTRLLAAHVRGRLDQLNARLEGSALRIEQAAGHQLARHGELISRSTATLQRCTAQLLDEEQESLRRRAAAACRTAEVLVSARISDLAAHRSLLRAFDPARQLERGWALVRDVDGRTVSSTRHLAAGDELSISLADGRVGAIVTAVETTER
jgi:exodeoxyribonuclease VII large subunit